MIKSTMKILQDLLESSELGISRIIHVKANLLDNICAIGSRESETLKVPRKNSGHKQVDNCH